MTLLNYCHFVIKKMSLCNHCTNVWTLLKCELVLRGGSLSTYTVIYHWNYIYSSFSCFVKFCLVLHFFGGQLSWDFDLTSSNCSIFGPGPIKSFNMYDRTVGYQTALSVPTQIVLCFLTKDIKKMHSGAKYRI